MSSDTVLPPIRHATWIDVSPERVYETLTTADGWNSWFTSRCTIDPVAGGSIVLEWSEWGPDAVSATDGGMVLEAVFPRRLSFQWTPHGVAKTVVTFELEPRASGTVLRVTDHGYPSTPDGLEAFADCAAGWGEALTLLKMFLEHGIRVSAGD